MQQKISRLEESVDQLGKSDKDFDDKICKLSANSTLEERKVKDCVMKAVELVSHEEKEEEEDRNKRKTSVIIHGIPESTSGNTKTRIDEDVNRCKSMIQEAGVQEIKILEAFRLGKKSIITNGSSSKPRPLKLVLEMEDQKTAVLKVSKNLKLEEEGQSKKIVIHQDFTCWEREERKIR